MPNAWMIADGIQGSFAEAIKDYLFLVENVMVSLYKNDHTPTLDDSLGNYTECDFSGYISENVFGSQWYSPVLVNHVLSIDYDTPFDWTVLAAPDPAQTVYGYYLTSDNGGVLMWSERFETPRLLALGDAINLSLKLRYTVLPWQ